MNVFEKLHRKLFPKDYVTANVISFAFLAAAEVAAEYEGGSFDVTRKALRRTVKTYSLNLSAEIHLVDEMIRYLEENTGYLSALTEQEADAAVIALCLLAYIVESENE